jgi:hypothetical protein
MSFREKSAWTGLLITLIVYGPYFTTVFSAISPRDGIWSPGLGDLLVAFIGAAILQVVLSIVFHVAIALHGRREQPDERDLAIESKSVRVAHGVLVAGFSMIGFGALAFGVASNVLDATVFQACVLLSQVVLFCLVVAEGAQYLTQVVAYRRGS